METIQYMQLPFRGDHKDDMYTVSSPCISSTALSILGMHGNDGRVVCIVSSGCC